MEDYYWPLLYSAVAAEHHHPFYTVTGLTLLLPLEKKPTFFQLKHSSKTHLEILGQYCKQ